MVCLEKKKVLLVQVCMRESEEFPSPSFDYRKKEEKITKKKKEKVQ